MNYFKDFVEGVARGVVSGVSERSAVLSASDVVEACCEQLGWSIDERLDANRVCLHFKDPRLGIRKVIVNVGSQEAMVGFAVFSAVSLPPQQVPADVLGYLLERNSELLVAWQMFVKEDGDLAFALDYCTFATGLWPDFFKTLCGTMVREVQEFDARMHKAGLLR
jgi:hypothetical protein